jgi:uncharacterized protein YcbK (DUF882 family)
MITVREQLTPHFSRSELRCHDGTDVPDEYLVNALQICRRAEILRAEVGPLFVTSGYRTPVWNRKVGGAKGSLHLKASALDLTSRLVSAKKLHAIYLKLIKAGKVEDGGLGLYRNWIHIDIGRPRRWSSGVEQK